jgi:hypothetical protein
VNDQPVGWAKQSVPINWTTRIFFKLTALDHHPFAALTEEREGSRRKKVVFDLLLRERRGE